MVFNTILHFSINRFLHAIFFFNLSFKCERDFELPYITKHHYFDAPIKKVVIDNNITVEFLRIGCTVKFSTVKFRYIE